MENAKTIDTLITTITRLDMDEPCSQVNETMYKGIIGSLMYLTVSKPDIIFSVGLCSRFQSSLKESHLKAGKRILRIESKQQMTIELKHVEADDPFQVTIIYTKCKPSMRIPLWQTLRLKSTSCSVPWCVIGDFNVIASVEEKIGGLPYQMKKYIDFLSMIEDYGLVDLGFYGPRYTWSNSIGLCSIGWKRLDRGMVNDNWLSSFLATTITHLAIAGFDHSHLLLELHMSAMWKFHQKLKTTSRALSVWSREQYGDIFQLPKEFKQKVGEAEEKWLSTNDPSDRASLHEIQAQYTKYLKTEEVVLRQKIQLHWFKYGDANSRYFHNLIIGRRRKLYIHKLKNKEGDWIQWDEAIGEAACEFFEEILSETEGVIKEDLLKCIPSMITPEDNVELINDPTLQELKKGIKKPNTGANVGITLDMDKADDRVSWAFTCIILRRVGFCEIIIDMIWRTMSNNWYLVFVNGTGYGFFKSTRGLKQGGPLSPALFIIGAELLSRMINNLTP
ncbi:uncharacterized protein LOC107813500 [Nicotiana tabacum]|uniref:uncharacterized protein LOC107813500 n=1 Tax=Nicotiana tabacum TaxID=4097 RepID=UPI003F4ED4FD